MTSETWKISNSYFYDIKNEAMISGTLTANDFNNYMRDNYSSEWNGNKKHKCEYCGQFGESQTACPHCGAPIE